MPQQGRAPGDLRNGRRLATDLKLVKDQAVECITTDAVRGGVREAFRTAARGKLEHGAGSEGVACKAAERWRNVEGRLACLERVRALK